VTSKSSESIEKSHPIVSVLKAISDDYRLAILSTLSEESKTVVELTDQLGIAQPLVSHHLKALREVGLISAVPEGRSNRYSICCAAIAEPIQFLSILASATPTNSGSSND
jgi:DNA-binding transcriptional ArsR family regulator